MYIHCVRSGIRLLEDTLYVHATVTHQNVEVARWMVNHIKHYYKASVVMS